MARTGLTPEVHKAIVASVAAGVPLSYACQAAGISWDTTRRWIAVGRGYIERQPSLRPETKSLYEKFVADIDAAEAQAVRRNVLQVEMPATAGDWKAAAWWLERRYPEAFGRQTRVTIQQSVEELESELRELLGTERANALIEEARQRVARLRREYEAERIEGVPELRAVGEARDPS